MKRTILLAVLSVLCLAVFASNAPEAKEKTELKVKYLGCAGWEITDGDLVTLVDPYVSRIRFASRNTNDPNDTRKVYSRDDYIESDTEQVDSIIGKVDYIFMTHTHTDHIYDVPYIAKKTGAKVIGTETTCNFLRSYGIPDEQLYEVQGGEDYQFEDFSIKIVPALHSALREKHYYSPKRITEPMEAPLKLSDCTEGGTLMFYIRYTSHKVLVAGGMNYIENEVKGLEPDILIPGVNGSKNQIYKYTERLLKATNFPGIILPTHWDSWSLPYGAPQEKAIERNILPFIEEVKAVTNKSEVRIPVHLETMIIK